MRARACTSSLPVLSVFTLVSDLLDNSRIALRTIPASSPSRDLTFATQAYTIYIKNTEAPQQF